MGGARLDGGVHGHGGAGSSSPTIAGELARVELSRHSVLVKTDGREPRELEAPSAAEPRIVSRGRARWRLERPARPGDRVLVAAGERAAAASRA